MRKTTISALLAGTLMLGGCAYGTGFGLDGGYGYDDRYGRVEITYAEERDRGVYTVQGRTDNRDRRRDQFTCEFSSSGRIIDFKLG